MLQNTNAPLMKVFVSVSVYLSVYICIAIACGFSMHVSVNPCECQHISSITNTHCIPLGF